MDIKKDIKGEMISCSSSLGLTTPTVHPLGGLPPEVWEKVLLDYLINDPDSLISCYRTCRTFERILEPEKSKFVFKIVAPHLKAKYLPSSDFFKCRQVCRSWRYSVDKTFKKLAPLRRDPAVHSGVPPYIWYNDTIGVVVNTSTDIRNFTTEIGSGSIPTENPFFHKTIKCISRFRDNDPESNRLFQDFSRLISEHGNSIESCVYLATGGRPESERQMEALFHHLPNLQSLAILKSAGGDYTNGLDWLIQRKDYLPPLPHLTSINIYLDDAALIAEMLLISYGTQIESFHCDFSVISTCAYLRGPAQKGSLQYLRDLDVFDAFGSSTFLERLLHFETPFLERLSLQYVEMGPRRQAFKSILKIIDKHSATLKEIRLPQKLFNWECESERDSEPNEFRRSVKVMLPSVRRLGVNIEVLECPAMNWFLRKFQNLKYLCITNYGVEFFIGEDELEKKLNKQLKPFWDVASFLKKITVERAYLHNLHFDRAEEQ